MKALPAFLIAFSFLLTSSGHAACIVYEQKLAVKMEIAGLIAEKNGASGPTAVAMKSVLEENISAKIRQYETVYQEKLDLDELNGYAATIKEEGETKARDLIEQDIKTRAHEVVAASPIIAEKSFPVGPVTHLMKLNLNMKVQTPAGNVAGGSGVQWSADEKFVLIRPEQANRKHAVLWNMEKGVQHAIDASTGWLSSKGHFYATNPEEAVTWVHDLETGDQYGPFEGRTYGYNFNDSVGWGFNDRFILLEHSHKPPNRNSSDTYVDVVEFKTGKVFRLGIKYQMKFNLSEDLSRAAIQNGDVIDVWNVVTGDQLKSYKVDADKSFSIDGTPRGIFVLKDGANQRLVRMSDLKEFEIPSTSTSPDLSGDGKKALLSESGGRKTILNMDDGSLLEFGEMNYQFSLDHNKILFYYDPEDLMPAILVDLKTLTQKSIDAPIVSITPDGRWGLEHRWVGDYTWHNIETGLIIKVKSFNSAEFLPNQDYAIVTVRHPAVTYLNQVQDMDRNFEQLQMGYDNIAASPSGRYILTYSNLERAGIVIREIKPKKQ